VRGVTLTGERIIHFSVEGGVKSIRQGQDLSYIRESYQWLGELSLLMTGCRT
jgi:hypothetical protein